MTPGAFSISSRGTVIPASRNASSSGLHGFKGIGEFAIRPPLVVTGDTYEDGRGVRRDDQLPGVDWGQDVHINIFNIMAQIKNSCRQGNTCTRN